MAGKPMTNALAANLATRATEEVGPDANALDYAAAWVASGQTLTSLAADLDVSYGLFAAYLRKTFGAPAVQAAIRDAREHAAHAYVDQSIDIADAATLQTANVARIRVQARQWAAERLNARELGQRPGVAVQVNVGALMLEALRQPAPARPTATATAIAEPAKLLTAGESATCDAAASAS